MSHPPKHPDPTPAEPLERMAEVNSEWTERERRQRAGVRDVVDMRVLCSEM